MTESAVFTVNIADSWMVASHLDYIKTSWFLILPYPVIVWSMRIGYLDLSVMLIREETGRYQSMSHWVSTVYWLPTLY